MQAVLGAPVDADTAQRMWSLTQGNALFMRHVMDEELATGRLFRTGGQWRWRGDAVVSAGLADLISSRMDGVDTAVADVLDLLAVSEPLDLAVLSRLADPVAIEHAEMNGLVSLTTRIERVEVRLAHPLYGEVRRARLGRLRGRGCVVPSRTGWPPPMVRPRNKRFVRLCSPSIPTFLQTQRCLAGEHSMRRSCST